MILENYASELISGAYIVPIVWFLLRNFKKYLNSNIQTIKKGFDDLTAAIEKQRHQFKENNDKLIRELSFAVGRTSLNKSQSIDTIREKMWYISEHKLNYIKDILLKNNLEKRKPQIQKNIKAELIRLSDTYIEELNNYNSELGNLGDLVTRLFDMESFLSDIFSVVFRLKEPSLDIELKINDIRTIMKNHQNILIYNIKEQTK